MVGAAGEMVLGGTLFIAGAGTSALGIGIPVAALGGVIFAHGLDSGIAGYQHATGNIEYQSYTSRMIQAAGVSRTTADLLDAGVGIVLTAGGGLLLRAPSVVAGLARGTAAIRGAASAGAAATASVARQAGLRAAYLADDAILTARQVADSSIRQALGNVCFSPETWVQSEDGLVRLGTIQRDDKVLSFNHPAGLWEPAEVIARHDNQYTGKFYRLTICNQMDPRESATEIAVTARHPFWVQNGPFLHERPLSEHLSPHEDEGLSLVGRWVDSDCLCVGDQVLGADGHSRVIVAVAVEDVVDEPVCNLTVRDHHTFAVGLAAILVHNAAWCELLEQVNPSMGRTAREAMAARLGVDVKAIHAHHIVQKKFNSAFAGIEGTKSWYISQTQEILRNAGVPVWDNLDDLESAVRIYQASGARPNVLNFTLAVNGRGTHSMATVMEVYSRLNARTNPLGVRRTLQLISREFEEHGTLLNPDNMLPW